MDLSVSPASAVKKTDHDGLHDLLTTDAKQEDTKPVVNFHDPKALPAAMKELSEVLQRVQENPETINDNLDEVVERCFHVRFARNKTILEPDEGIEAFCFLATVWNRFTAHWGLGRPGDSEVLPVDEGQPKFLSGLRVAKELGTEPIRPSRPPSPNSQALTSAPSDTSESKQASETGTEQDCSSELTITGGEEASAVREAVPAVKFGTASPVFTPRSRQPLAIETSTLRHEDVLQAPKVGQSLGSQNAALRRELRLFESQLKLAKTATLAAMNEQEVQIAVDGTKIDKLTLELTKQEDQMASDETKIDQLRQQLTQTMERNNVFYQRLVKTTASMHGLIVDDQQLRQLCRKMVQEAKALTSIPTSTSTSASN